MRNFHIGLVSAAVLALTSAPPLSAQTQPDTAITDDDADPTINVIGRKQSEEEARREANDFVRRTGIANGEAPVARWVGPVCPRVLGIQENYAAIVEQKVRAIAQKADIRLAPAPCKANVVISFATDARAVVQRIAQKAPGRIAEVSGPARSALLKGDAPIRWWYTTQETGVDGISATVSDNLAANAGTAEGGGSSIGNGLPTIQAYSSSIIRTQVVRALRSATVVIDVKLAQGVPLDAVADYAAMVAFAEIKPSQMPPPNSVLGLFGKRKGLVGEGKGLVGEGKELVAATDWDINFLRALYSIPAARAGWKQRRMLVGEIMKGAEAAGQIDDDDLTEGLGDQR